MHPVWSWELSQQRGWIPSNLTEMSPQYLNICLTGFEGKEWAGSAPDEQPWYNAPPSAHVGSPIILLMALGLGTLIGSAVLLKLLLNFLVRSTTLAKRTQPASSLVRKFTHT